MSLRERLVDFSGSIAVATRDAPDDYAEWSYMTYESHMSDLRELWADIRPKLKRDLDKVEFIEQRLTDMFSAFESGEKEAGRKAAWDIYNLEVEKLR